MFDSVCEFFGETIRNMFGVVVSVLLNLMKMLSVGGGLEVLCWIDRV